MSEKPQRLQFGVASPQMAYQDRYAVFGLLIQDGQIATVRVSRDLAYHDLPGGAVEAGETEQQALIREFREETGLSVRPGERLLDAAQFFTKSDGVPVNNFGGIWTVEALGYNAGAKIEDDHELVWMPPGLAVERLRHDAHAWAVASWLRRQIRTMPTHL